jgi:adenylylsulfate reductase subunit B
MPTFVYMAKCDGCGKCVDICPSDIMHLAPGQRKATNIEPDYCWECYSCVKECPQHAIDVRGYADFAPLGHKVTVLREKDKGVISWKIVYRNGSRKEFTFPIRTTPFGSIKIPDEHDSPKSEDVKSQVLSHEPEFLMTSGGLPTLARPAEPRKEK